LLSTTSPATGMSFSRETVSTTTTTPRRRRITMTWWVMPATRCSTPSTWTWATTMTGPTTRSPSGCA